MTLQTSGAISLSQVQGEFGGSAPIYMSEYYRGGSYVPTSVGGSAGSWSSYYGTLYSYYWESSGTALLLKWNSSTVYTTSSSSATSVTTGGYEYGRGSLFTSSGGGKGGGPVTYYYQIRRRTTGSSTAVNTNVPSSGTISMNQFYGGRNS